MNLQREKLVIIDYGTGNLGSVGKAFRHVVSAHSLPVDIVISGDAKDVAQADRIVLPGQGAFGDCINALRKIPDMVNTLETKVLKESVPFFGICVGMQLLADVGHEFGEHKGLGWISGRVIKIEPNDKSLKIPHMGWNTVEKTLYATQHKYIQNIDNKEHFYFVHSYQYQCDVAQHLLAYAEYGDQVAAIIGRDNILGVQFHPEKSQSAGLHLIKDFLIS